MWLDVRLHPLLGLGVLAALAVACKDPPPPKPRVHVDAGRREPELWGPRDAAPPPVLDAGPPADAGRPSGSRGLDGHDGASACRLLYGPEEQPFRGPAALRPREGYLELVLNEAGRPKTTRVPIAPLSAPAPKPTAPVSPYAVTWPACAVGGKYVYCLGSAGAIMRTPLAGGEGKEVAKGRPSTRIAAAALAGEHSVVGYLAARKTAEGSTLEAWAAVDAEPPTKLSEDGSGATWLDLAPRAESVVALYLDARAAMTPVHSRHIAWAGGKAEVRKDAVVFVGGPPDRGITGTLAVLSPNDVFGLVPIAEDVYKFSMLSVRIEDPPREDMGAAASPYPNGLDPAPIATSGAFLVRVRPENAQPTSPRVLELGRLDTKGVFTSLGIVSTGRPYADVAMATDSLGALWILYGDATATFLERRLCPPK